MTAMDWILGLSASVLFAIYILAVSIIDERNRDRQLTEGRRLRAWMDEMGYDE